jgi:hypothetical protein
VRARFARPLAITVAAASSLAIGAWTALLLAVLIVPTSRGERVLTGLLAAVACAGLAALHIKILRPRWESTTAIVAHTRSPARALIAGVLAFGALELAAFALLAVVHVEPLGLTTRVVISGAVAIVGLCWQRWKLGALVVRWIG